MSDWQDISTAPKDGTEFLAAYSTEYRSNDELRKICDFSIVSWEDGRWRAKADGRFAIDAQGDTYTDYIEPFVTHWMPLPAPPETKGDE